MGLVWFGLKGAGSWLPALRIWAVDWLIMIPVDECHEVVWFSIAFISPAFEYLLVR